MFRALPASQPLSRRELWKSVIAIAASRSLAANIADKAPELHFPVEPRRRISVTSFSFHDYIAASNVSAGKSRRLFDMKAFPALIAERFGIYNVDPLAGHFSSTEPAYLEEFRTAVGRAKSNVINLCLGSGHFYDRDPETRRAAIAAGQKGIDVAVAIGSPSVRQHISAARGLQPDVNLASDSLSRLTEYAVRRGVIINLHNDHLIEEDPFFLVQVIQKVSSRYLRALPDFGDSLAGHDTDFNDRALRAMFPYALNVCHVKDSVGRENAPPAIVDLPRMFNLAKDAGYRGYFSMEFDGPDPFAGTRRLVAETLKYLC